jgi:hypothetical protein
LLKKKLRRSLASLSDLSYKAFLVKHRQNYRGQSKQVVAMALSGLLGLSEQPAWQAKLKDSNLEGEWDEMVQGLKRICKGRHLLPVTATLDNC